MRPPSSLDSMPTAPNSRVASPPTVSAARPKPASALAPSPLPSPNTASHTRSTAYTPTLVISTSIAPTGAEADA